MITNILKKTSKFLLLAICRGLTNQLMRHHNGYR